MSLPQDLQTALARAKASLQTDPQHGLRPIYRQTIYQALGPVEDALARRKRGNLAVRTAQRVLPVWEQAFPDNPLPHLCLMRARQAMDGSVGETILNAEAEDAWSQLEAFGANLDAAYYRAFYAADAARKALNEALGEEPFDELELTGNFTDADHDPYTIDAAGRAMEVYAGTPWRATFDVAAQNEFWVWCLEEAVPAAWRLDDLQ